MTRNQNEAFVKKLKIALLESHLNTVSLAKKLGIQPGSVSKWMTGENNPKLSTLKKIAKITEKPINYFFDNSTEVKGNQNIVQSKNISVGKMDYEKEILLIKKELEVQRYKLENLELKLEKNNKK